MGKMRNQKRDYDSEPTPKPDKKTFHLKDLTNVHGKSENHRGFIDEYLNTETETFLVTGYPGTGKTFLSAFLALNDILDETRDQDKIVIFRSAVESRKIGFLPGTEQEKAQSYEKPYASVFRDLIKGEHWKTYEWLKDAGLVDFELSSNQRGVTYHNAVMIVDEAQNLTFEELDTIYTRGGRNCRIIFCGDKAQDDLVHYKGQLSGLDKFKSVLETAGDVGIHNFYDFDDIVRDGRVRRYVEAKVKLGMI